jgi:hypothetical protein
MMSAFEYDTLLNIRPASVDLGFIYTLMMPTTLVYLFAIYSLWQYLSHGKRLQDIHSALTLQKSQVKVLH